jgi:hypothetical protein
LRAVLATLATPVSFRDHSCPSCGWQVLTPPELLWGVDGVELARRNLAAVAKGVLGLARRVVGCKGARAHAMQSRSQSWTGSTDARASAAVSAAVGPSLFRMLRHFLLCCNADPCVSARTHYRAVLRPGLRSYAVDVRACVRASAVACVCVCVRARVSHARAPLRHRLESPLACSPPPLECEFQPPRHAHTPHVPVPRTDAGCGRGAATPSRRNHARIRTALEAGERFWCTRVLEAGPPAMDGFGAHGYWRCACRPCR